MKGTKVEKASIILLIPIFFHHYHLSSCSLYEHMPLLALSPQHYHSYIFPCSTFSISPYHPPLPVRSKHFENNIVPISIFKFYYSSFDRTNLLKGIVT